MKNVIVSQLLPSHMREKLYDAGFKCISGGRSSVIDNETAYHPDMLYFKLPDGKLLVSASAHPVHNLDTFCELKISKTVQGAEYPKDCVFNCFCTKYCLFSGKYTAEEIIESCEGYGLKNVCVRQGYAACSTIKAAPTAFITSDAGIAKALESTGHDALLVSNEGIKLKGYGNGFIGGCAQSDDDAIFFTGNIEAHKDYERIKTFCKRYGKTVNSLSDDVLYDYGGFIILD